MASTSRGPLPGEMASTSRWPIPGEMASTSRGPLPGGPRSPTRSSPRHRPAWGTPTRSSPRHRPAWGTPTPSSPRQSVPTTPLPLGGEQRFPQPARAVPVLLTPTRASQAIGVVYQPIAG